ncbi:WD40 repeat domain-containing protein [Actinophytocola xanthii]|uniref:Uncharacterized protein n=1 Tax=Actinophytocola xanthii TaxID=1912961 RepID=A0A1Q8CPG1_9PSEU|nr:WD40 repeat domain-containing protein [Actinophytocola xanthii]OLF16228.1 hypothetical protein BU204_17820 [Actinophytocola xanthii]
MEITTSRLSVAGAGDVNALAWHPHGTLIALSCAAQAQVWHVASRTALAVWSGHPVWITALAWSPSGEWLACSFGDGTVRLWNPESGATKEMPGSHRDVALTVAWAPDGTGLASGGRDGSIRLWGLEEKAECTVQVGHEGPVNALAWSGKRIASGGEDGTVRLWETETGARTVLGRHSARVSALAWSPDRTALLSASREGTVLRWDLTTGTSTTVAKGELNGVFELVWSPARARVVGLGAGGVRQRDLRTGAAVTSAVPHREVTRAAGWSPDGGLLATVTREGGVRLADGTSGAEVAAWTARQDSVRTVRWSPDGCRLAAGGDDGVVRVWNPATGSATTTIEHGARVNFLEWSPCGTLLAGGGDGDMVRIWDADSGAAVTTHTGRCAGVISLGWSPDGGRLVTAGWDGFVRFWSTWGPLGELYGGGAAVWCVAWSPDGATVAAGVSGGGTGASAVRLWDAETRTEVGVAHTGWADVLALAWSPTGGLYTGDNEGVVRYWDSRLTPPGLVVDELPGEVRALRCSPDGTRILSATESGALREVREGHPQRQLSVASSIGDVIALHPDLDAVATGGSAGVVTVTRLPPSEAAPPVRLLGLPDRGWAAFWGEDRYRLRGDPAGRFWWSTGLRRHEPGELDGRGVTRLDQSAARGPGPSPR